MAHNKPFSGIGLTSAEIAQLKNIDTTTISVAQWQYVGNLDQNLRTSDAVTFGSLITTPGGVASSAAIRIGGNLIPYTSGTNLTIIGSEDASGQLILNSTSNGTKGYVSIPETTGSTSKITGCLVLGGGLGVGEDIWCDEFHMHNSTGFISQTGGHLLITGETGASGQLILRSTTNATKGYVYVDETTASSSTSTGCLVLGGGLGVAGAINAASFTGTCKNAYTAVGFGFIANLAANTSYVLCRASTASANAASTFTCPYACRLKALSVAMDNTGEWTAGTIQIRVYDDNSSIYDTTALTSAGYSSTTLPDASTHYHQYFTTDQAIAAGSVLSVYVTTGATYAGNTDGPFVDLLLQWD